MDTVANTLLSNALAAGLLAILAALAGRLCRRPALVHALWLLVLLKLVTPPLVSVPLPWVPVPEAAPLTDTVVQASVETPPALKSPPSLSDLPDLDDFNPADPVSVATLVEPPRTETIPETEPVAETPPAFAGVVSPVAVPWLDILFGVWLAGTVGWFGVALARLRRFQCLLRWVQPAPAKTRARLGELAARLGLSRWPEVWLMPGAVAPLLWALGRPALLLVPADLWERLDDEQRDALLLHELAHWKRRDHWVRWLEFVALGLYWWHPVAWWARRELREAEEQCCDAWVVWALPAATRAYANALVETVDFLSTSRPRMPALASGMGHVYDLRRRLTMILRGTTPRTLTWAGVFAVFAVATVLLPLAPSWGQQPPAERQRREAEEQRRRAEQERDKAEQREREKPRATQEKDRAEAQVRTQAEIRELTAHLERMRAEMEKAQRRLHELHAQMGGGSRPEFRPPGTPPGERRPGQPGREAPFGAGARAFPGGPGGPGGGNMEQRLQEIERKLDMLMRAMEGMRPDGRPIQPPRPGDGPRPPQPPRGERPGDGDRRPDERPRPQPPRGEGERGAQPPRPAEAPRPPLPPQPPRGDGERRPTPRPDQPETPRGERPATR